MRVPGRLEITEKWTSRRRRGLRIDTEPAAVLCQVAARRPERPVGSVSPS